MTRAVFDGFSVVLPEGWSDVLDDATYSDPDALPPIAFAAIGGAGTLYVGVALFTRDAQPGASAREMEALAIEWGERRGQASAIAITSHATPAYGSARAIYRLADDYVEVTFLSDGRGVICASYICPWNEEPRDRQGREAILASLRFA